MIHIRHGIRNTEKISSGGGTGASVALSGPALHEGADIEIVATFSEGVTGISSGDLTLTNATLDSFLAKNSTRYTWTVTPIDEFLPITAQLPASAGSNISDGNPTQQSNLFESI